MRFWMVISGIIIISLMCARNTLAADAIFSIEDEDFFAVDEAYSKAVSSDKSFIPFNESGCSLIGKNIPASMESNSVVILMTTADGCGWGASMGPMWILIRNRDILKIVLYSGGYSVKILPRHAWGMFDVSINHGGVNSDYRFNGCRYVIKNEISLGKDEATLSYF